MKWKKAAAVCVVMAAKGYPGSYVTGQPIDGLKDAESLANVCVFHAGTTRNAGGRMVTGVVTWA